MGRAGRSEALLPDLAGFSPVQLENTKVPLWVRGLRYQNIKDLVKPRKTLRGVLPEKSKNCLKQRNI